MDDHTLALKLLNSGYYDYIAARYLLNQEKHIFQGVMLASTGVEKYIKAVLAALGLRSRMRVHLHELTKLQQLLTQHYTDFTRFFDPYFLQILGDVYRHRYFDVNQSVTIGFFMNQFLGELDSIIYYIECIVLESISDEADNSVKTIYKVMMEKQEEGLFLNNYILNQMNKKEFMEKPTNAYALYLDPLRPGIQVNGRQVVQPYTGQMTQINVAFS